MDPGLRPVDTDGGWKLRLQREGGTAQGICRGLGIVGFAVGRVASMTCRHFSVQILEDDGDEVHRNSPVTLNCFQSPVTRGCRRVHRGLSGPEEGQGQPAEGSGLAPRRPAGSSRAGVLGALFCFNVLLTRVSGYGSSCHTLSYTLIKAPTKTL